MTPSGLYHRAARALLGLLSPKANEDNIIVLFGKWGYIVPEEQLRHGRFPLWKYLLPGAVGVICLVLMIGSIFYTDHLLRATLQERYPALTAEVVKNLLGQVAEEKRKEKGAQ